jgi:hypothetical protein
MLCDSFRQFGCVCEVGGTPTPYPTVAPSITTNDVILFSDNSISGQGEIGNRADSTLYCQYLYDYLIAGDGPLRDDPCDTSTIQMFISYTGDAVADFPTPSPTSVAKGPTGTTLAPWANFKTGVALSNSLFTAGVFDYAAPTAWWSGSSTTGTSPTPTPTPSCTGWTSLAASPTVGTIGDLNTATVGTWLSSSTTTGCNTYARRMCYCTAK